MKEGEESTKRNKISFEEASGPTHYSRNSFISFLSYYRQFYVEKNSRIQEILMQNQFETNHLSEQKRTIFQLSWQFKFAEAYFAKGNLSKCQMLWSQLYGLQIITNFISRQKFQLIMRYMRFDDKNTINARAATDLFAPIRDIRNRFIESCF